MHGSLGVRGCVCCVCVCACVQRSTCRCFYGGPREVFWRRHSASTSRACVSSSVQYEARILSGMDGVSTQTGAATRQVSLAQGGGLQVFVRLPDLQLTQSRCPLEMPPLKTPAEPWISRRILGSHGGLASTVDPPLLPTGCELSPRLLPPRRHLKSYRYRAVDGVLALRCRLLLRPLMIMPALPACCWG